MKRKWAKRKSELSDSKIMKIDEHKKDKGTRCVLEMVMNLISGRTRCRLPYGSAIELKRPPMYKVILLNDDYTPMEFVVHILEHSPV